MFGLGRSGSRGGKQLSYFYHTSALFYHIPPQLLRMNVVELAAILKTKVHPDKLRSRAACKASSLRESVLSGLDAADPNHVSVGVDIKFSRKRCPELARGTAELGELERKGVKCGG